MMAVSSFQLSPDQFVSSQFAVCSQWPGRSQMRAAQLGHPGLQTVHGWPGRYIQVSGWEGGSVHR